MIINCCRLWGDHGQASLENCQVCLINATGLGTEILKSLVLPGIGGFTIVDGKKVTEEDLGIKWVISFSDAFSIYFIFSYVVVYDVFCCSFFLDSESIGKPRALIATQLLLELNQDVKGDYVDESIEQLLENNPNFFSNFSVVIATSITERW